MICVSTHFACKTFFKEMLGNSDLIDFDLMDKFFDHFPSGVTVT